MSRFNEKMSLLIKVFVLIVVLIMFYQVFVSIEQHQAVYIRRIANKTRLWKQVFNELFY